MEPNTASPAEKDCTPQMDSVSVTAPKDSSLILMEYAKNATLNAAIASAIAAASA